MDLRPLTRILPLEELPDHESATFDEDSASRGASRARICDASRGFRPSRSFQIRNLLPLTRIPPLDEFPEHESAASLGFRVSKSFQSTNLRPLVRISLLEELPASFFEFASSLTAATASLMQEGA